MICQTKHKRKNKCSPNLFRLLSRENVKSVETIYTKTTMIRLDEF